jgi:hypothetical protein
MSNRAGKFAPRSNRHELAAMVLAGAGLVACTAQGVPRAQGVPPAVLRIDFENDQIVPGSGTAGVQDILKVSAGPIPILYEGGTREDRLAEIVADPENEKNQVLRTWIRNASIPSGRKGWDKGRIQLNFTSVNKTSVFERHRMYLHPDIAHYRSYPQESKWFGIATMWMGDTSKPNAFMISVDIAKDAGVGKPLYFMVAGEKRLGGLLGQGQWQFVWNEVNRKFEVPVGVWMDVEIGYRQGDAKSGRFFMSVRPADDAQPTTIFDITNWTYHPAAAKPMPMTRWNPIKLYTSEKLVDHIRNQGGLAQIYWDDLQISASWPR